MLKNCLILALVVPIFLYAEHLHATIIAYSDDAIKAKGESSMNNDFLAENQAINSALLQIQEFLEGSVVDGEQYAKEKMENGRYTLSFSDKLRKKVRKGIPLKYKLLKKGRQDGIYFVILEVNSSLYRDTQILKENFLLGQKGIRGLNCTRLSHQACNYLMEYVNNNYNSTINLHSPFELIFNTETTMELDSNKNCSVENLGNTLIFNGSNCRGKLIINSTLFAGRLEERSTITQRHTTVCHNIDLKEVLIYDGFPSLYDDRESKLCGRQFFNDAISALDRFMVKIQ